MRTSLRTSPLAAVLFSACAPALSTPSARISAQWVGCYVVQWSDSNRFVDSLELIASGPRILRSQVGFRKTFYDDSHRVIGTRESGPFTGPGWYLRGDTVFIAEGILSGWGITAHASPDGFIGVVTTFTDCCVPPLKHDYAVAAQRVPCPTARAT